MTVSKQGTNTRAYNTSGYSNVFNSKFNAVVSFDQDFRKPSISNIDGAKC